ncbi:prolyl oligopeptidase family serine peptidase [Brevibacterium linens]|uniref:Oligopeptidase B n=1 Tax=Brevibacterium linens TaxID=1703 RepID=A0A2H1I1L3_BRELN|nr:prolyl oligopeptidase family serine peptidase [Brevibacterium linens]SMX69087.1 oligopeptidase B [Brevibacterium linens]
MFAIIGDIDGDENYRIRIYTAAANGAELVHDEAPVSPRARAFGSGILWIRRDESLRPNQLLWWHPGSSRPTALADEPDSTRRLELRSVTDDTAILASRGAGTTRHWSISGHDGTIPTCRPLRQGISDADVAVWQQTVVVLDRPNGLLWDHDREHVLASTPPGFSAEHLQPSGDALLVIGRADERQAIWLPAHGPQAIWTAPPAGTMLPAFNSGNEQLILLASSPVHQPQVVPAEVGKNLSLESTGRASTLCLDAESEDGTMIPITLFLPNGEQKHPLVVHVYGAYGISLEGPFDPFTDDLLARGVAVAFCHIRGGGELGSQWHRQATGEYRYRTVDDFLACLARLRALPAIAADRIVVTAASAGGLTAAAACLRQPTWLRGLHLVHPFIDPLATLTDPASNLASTDRAEYGDPRHDPAIRDLLQRLSPMARIQELPAQSHPLPRAWIRAAERDARADNDAIHRFSRHYRDASISRRPGHVVQRITPGGHLAGGSIEATDDENTLAHAWMLNVLGAPYGRNKPTGTVEGSAPATCSTARTTRTGYQTEP